VSATRRGRAVLATAGALVLALGIQVAGAQDEPLRGLIGTWQGQVDVRREPERTLVIESVTRRGDRWIASIQYGTTGQTLARLEAQVEMSGPTPTLMFATSADSKTELKLVSERELFGFLKIRAEGQSWVSRKIRLEKTRTTP
jgi:hypothetical protein